MWSGDYKKLPGFITRALRYMFHVRTTRVVLFRLEMEKWAPRNLLPMIRNYRVSPIVPSLVESLFSDDPVRRDLFRIYLSSGANGVVIHNREEWIACSWHLNLSRREKRLLLPSRHYTFVGLPRDLKLEQPSYYCFSGEVHPKYRARGVFLFLIHESFRRIREISPNAVLYSSVDYGNEASIKAKLMMGEQPVGVYYAWYLRLVGRHFSNLFTSRLSVTDTVIDRTFRDYKSAESRLGGQTASGRDSDKDRQSGLITPVRAFEQTHNEGK